jgi:hypothetical protein
MEPDPQDVVTRTGGLTKTATGLATVAEWYRDEMIKVEGDWDGLSPQERIEALLGPANSALGKFGVPPVTTGQSLGGDDNPSFSRAGWWVLCNERFADFDSSRQQFHQKFTLAAGSIYHEARHAEQVFRVARKLAFEGKTPKEIGQMLGITERITQQAAKVPLSDEQKDEWAQARAWQLNLEGTGGNPAPADTVNQQMLAAKDAYHNAQGHWENYQYTVTGNPKVTPEFKRLYDDTIAGDGGPEKWAQRGEDWRLKYIRAREWFKQWFTFYAKMPVEEDAWAVGGQVEYLLTGKAFTAQDVLADLSPDERTMTPIVSDQERRLLVALLEQFGPEGNMPPQ